MGGGGPLSPWNLSALHPLAACPSQAGRRGGRTPRAKCCPQVGGALSTLSYISLHLPTSPYISLHLPTSPYISLHLPTSPYISLYRWAARSRRSPPSAASASTRASPALCLCLISRGEGVARSRLRVIAHDARSSHPGQVRRALMARHLRAPRRTPLLRRRPLRPPRPRPPRGEPERDPPQRGQHRHEAVSVRRQLIVGL